MILKSYLQKTLSLFGLRFDRLPRHQRWYEKAEVVVPVGNYKIRMPSTSLLPELFSANPNYSSELGRLVAAVWEKYPGLHVLDVGANFGDSVAIIKSAVNVPVTCVEGDEQCFNLLENNIKQFDGVTLCKLFLGDRSETVSVTIEKKGWNATLVPSRNGNSLKVELKTLDDFLPAFGSLNAFKVLKIDTEGFDCRIIRGGMEFIREVKPVITFEYNRDNMRRIGEDGLTTLSLLQDIGYNIMLFYDGQGRLVTASTLNDEELLTDLHTYANGRNGAIYYYDLCLFHREDDDIAVSFRQTERDKVRQADKALTHNI